MSKVVRVDGTIMCPEIETYACQLNNWFIDQVDWFGTPDGLYYTAWGLGFFAVAFIIFGLFVDKRRG